MTARPRAGGPGAHGGPAPETEDGSARGTGESRTAEEVAEEWAARIARWTVRGVARAREEAEDIWAEAQALRRDL